MLATGLDGPLSARQLSRAEASLYSQHCVAPLNLDLYN